MNTDDLLPEYERELAILRQSLGEFAQRYPKVAAKLGISGGHSDDPQVERLVQAGALINARASARIEDDFPQFTKALLEIAYPEFLRPFPACSIAQFAGSSAASKLSAPLVIGRGTELKAPLKKYLFRTTYDIALAPLRIEDARYALNTSAPSKITLPQDTAGLMSITLSPPVPAAEFGRACPATVRVFVDGERTLVAAIMDTLLLRATSAFVEVDRLGVWTQLESVPIAQVGFGPDEALIELNDSPSSPYRLLSEYFAFPRKFDFVDIDMQALVRCAGRSHCVTLHLPVSGVHRDSARARTMQHLSSNNLKLFCTPVINLFPRAATPIAPGDMQFAVYPVVPDALTASDATVYSVDSVRLAEGPHTSGKVTPIMPYHSLRHHPTPNCSPLYWIASRGARLAEFLPGHDMLISLVDDTGKPIETQTRQVDAELRCTNGNLPASMPIGAPEGDLAIEHHVCAGRIVLLHRPTQSVPAPMERWQLWELISMISSGPILLDQTGLPALKTLLAQHARPHDANAARHIDSLTGLKRETFREWVEMEPQPTFVLALRVRLMVDDHALHDCSLSVLAGVLEGLFAQYAPTSNFVQLVLISGQNGAELVRGRSLPGTRPIL